MDPKLTTADLGSRKNIQKAVYQNSAKHLGTTHTHPQFWIHIWRRHFLKCTIARCTVRRQWRSYTPLLCYLNNYLQTFYIGKHRYFFHWERNSKKKKTLKHASNMSITSLCLSISWSLYPMQPATSHDFPNHITCIFLKHKSTLVNFKVS